MNQRDIEPITTALARLSISERNALLRDVLASTADEEIEEMAERLTEVRGLGLQSARELLFVIGLKEIELEP